MKYKAVLFDLDGTLLDTLDDLADSMNETLTSMGFPTHPIASYKFFVGDGVDVLARRALPSGSDESVVQTCINGMRATYDRRMFNKTKPYPGIPELLDGLTDKNITLAILSNKPDSATAVIVNKLLASWNFAVVAGHKAGIAKKPDPAAARTIAQSLRLEPKDFLYLGDTSTDMRTAVSAGMYPVGALWGFRDKKELMESGAKIVIDRPEDLIKLL